VLGVTVGSDAGAGAIGATGFGRAIELGTGLGAAFVITAFFVAALFGAAFLARAFFGATFLAFLATFALLAFFTGRAFFFAVLFLATARFAFACGRFFPLALAFFFAMVSLLLGVNPIIVRVALKKSAVICARRWSRR
jgi:hypothetical protein